MTGATKRPSRNVRLLSRRSAMGLVLLVVAFGLVLASLFSPWWTLTFSEADGSSSSVSTYLPGSFEIYGTNQSEVTCSMAGGIAVNANVKCPALNETPVLYHGAFALALGAIVGLGAAIVLLARELFSPTSAARGRRAGLGIAILAVVLIAGASALIAAGQPGAFAADSGSSPGATPFGIFPSWCPHTPANSFFAGCTSAIGGEGIHWAPAGGWILGVIASGIALVGLLLAFRGPPARIRTVPRAAARAARSAAPPVPAPAPASPGDSSEIGTP